MSLRVVYYQSAHQAAVRAFNARMRAADPLIFRLPESAPAMSPGTPVPGMEFRHFVVLDDAGEVRGGYFIRTQPFYIRGRIWMDAVDFAVARVVGQPAKSPSV